MQNKSSSSSLTKYRRKYTFDQIGHYRACDDGYKGHAEREADQNAAGAINLNAQLGSDELGLQCQRERKLTSILNGLSEKLILPIGGGRYGLWLGSVLASPTLLISALSLG